MYQNFSLPKYNNKKIDKMLSMSTLPDPTYFLLLKKSTNKSQLYINRHIYFATMISLTEPLISYSFNTKIQNPNFVIISL